MGRIRTIKPEFPQSESMGRLSRDARLLFIQLWTLVDDDGRARASSRMLASLLYPYDDDAKDLLDRWLCELEREQCIQRYSVDGNAYLQVEKWTQHQKIDHKTHSKLPAPPGALAKAREDSRILAPDLGRDQGKEEEGKGRGTPKAASACGAEFQDSTLVWQLLQEATGLSGTFLSRTVHEVATVEMAAGRTCEDIAKSFADAWAEYVESDKAGKLAHSSKPEPFFGDGLWRDKHRWKWKKGYSPPLTIAGPAKVRSPQEQAYYDSLDKKAG